MEDSSQNADRLITNKLIMPLVMHNIWLSIHFILLQHYHCLHLSDVVVFT